MARWERDRPVEAPDGSFVCEAFHLPVSYIRHRDYAFWQELEASDSDDDVESPEDGDAESPEDGGSNDVGHGGSNDVGHVQNSSDGGVILGMGVEKEFQEPVSDHTSVGDSNLEQTPIDFTPAALFVPSDPSDTPDMLFTRGATWRFFRHTQDRQILVYTHGTCFINGSSGSIGGCAFVFRGGVSADDSKKGIISFRLEDCGPTGIEHAHSSNRAELRAVVAALQFRPWNTEGHKELVIATDSDYVEKGATAWIESWVSRGWRFNHARDIPNRDLWELLFKEIQKFKESQKPLRVLFWHIPRALNAVAEEAATKAAETEGPQPLFCRMQGVLC